MFRESSVIDFSHVKLPLGVRLAAGRHPLVPPRLVVPPPFPMPLFAGNPGNGEDVVRHHARLGLPSLVRHPYGREDVGRDLYDMYGPQISAVEAGETLPDIPRA